MKPQLKTTPTLCQQLQAPLGLWDSNLAAHWCVSLCAMCMCASSAVLGYYDCVPHTSFRPHHQEMPLHLEPTHLVNPTPVLRELPLTPAGWILLAVPVASPSHCLNSHVACDHCTSCLGVTTSVHLEAPSRASLFTAVCASCLLVIVPVRYMHHTAVSNLSIGNFETRIAKQINT